MEYPKINTLFKRDANNIIIPSQFTQPEFEYLKDNKFECTEKIDGTNIRIEIKGKEITFFNKLKNKYGDNPNPIQPVNLKYNE